MKNIRVLNTPDEIRKYFRKTFKTELFRKEMDIPGSLINKVVESAAKYPLFIYDFSDHPSADTPDKQKTEWAHFGAWMGGITAREYENPAVSDAYYLHELYHKGFMSYQPKMDFDAWKRKIFDNELEASVTSELELYFRHPEFRDQTFPFEILADRYLKDPKFVKAWERDPEAARRLVREQRRDFMHKENLTDPVTKWIHKFTLQNEVWAGNWSQSYDLVETKMRQLHDEIDEDVPRDKAMKKFMDWLMSPEVTQGGEIPFPHEAKAFAAEYQKNMYYYQKAIAVGGEMPRRDAKKLLAEAYPGMTPREALTGPMAKAVAGELPAYSGLTRHALLNVPSVVPGSFAVTYALDMSLTNPETQRRGEPVVVFQKRADKGPSGEDRFGTLGGFTSVIENAEKKMTTEQPQEGCLREVNEELVDDKGIPILSLDPKSKEHRKRLNLISVGHDFRNEELPTTYAGFALELTADELAKTRVHSEKMQNDVAYAAAAKEASKGEVAEILVKPLREVLKMKKEDFTHPHEFEAIQILAEQLKKHAQTTERLV